MEGTEEVSNFRGKRVIALFDVDQTMTPAR